ncbi:MAG: RNA 2',3'-cyclic phosphodiesterase [Ignavibacteriaceae bacterium]
MNRLFIALKIPDNVIDEIIFHRNHAFPEYEKYRWEPFEKIHLTLKFIGEVKSESVQPIVEALNFIEEYDSLICRLNRFGFFYVGSQPKVLNLGIQTDRKIYELVEKINLKLEKFSIEPDRKRYIPHITLKRMKGNEGEYFVNRFTSYYLPKINFEIYEAALIESRLLAASSEYTTIKNYLLR